MTVILTHTKDQREGGYGIPRVYFKTMVPSS
jgi:hypothetical protein